jgi:hypothetical protein
VERCHERHGPRRHLARQQGADRMRYRVVDVKDVEYHNENG